MRLAELIEKQHHLDLAVVCRVTEQVASDLDALHTKRRLHRDIKPANILVGGDGTASITGPGLADDPGGGPLTTPGHGFGSLDYMAPELIRSEELTPAADVYSLGCIVYECLCGAPPFGDRRGMATLWGHLRDNPARPSDRRPDLPPAVNHAVLRALEKDPAQRTQTAGELAQQLRNACN